MAYEFKLPDIGEGVHEGEIVQWLVQQGDFVKEDQAIVEVMTDKVTAEIPAPVSGVIQELRGKAGEVITVGSVIAVFGEAGASTASTEKAAEASANDSKTNGNGRTATATMTAPSTSQGNVGKVLAAPATRKLARTLGVDLSQVTGSGPRGRVIPEDIRKFQPGSAAPASRPATSAASVILSQGQRRVPMSGLRRKIAEHLVKSKHTAPHFAYVEEVDMSRLVAMREELMPLAEAEGVKLSYLPFVMKAVIAGLRKYPILNSQLDEQTQELVYKHDINLGVAVATEQGLIVPVIKQADHKSLFTLATEIKTLAEKARNGKLTLDELKGGTFTLTSIGSIGGLFGVPIINYPEVAILGVNKIEKRPVVRTINGQDQIVIRDMMHLSISCDHRVVDGAEAALFVKEVIQYLENPTRLIAAL
ncbi:dihydrolipoamide acetyltransferase family protein [Vampirovibrio chlorellavorus]|uniref:dihydrolipoamide acetyltransferase family protein n=1 Tax=Vampirovibrio chlorellavorus TaxID=758823 RepID=UPI0026EDC6E1|nr:dihydrolipoamide acetyltransferase family protein [Vampirovibrio chlorellavorus]